MTSASESTKLPPESEDGKRGDLPVLGGRADPRVIKLVDRAAVEIGTKRGYFVVEAAIEKATAVLGADEARRILEAA